MARMLSISRAFTDGLLRSFAFGRHPFAPTTEAELWRLKSLYELFDIHVTRLMLPEEWTMTSVLAEGSSRSPLPSSLISLAWAPVAFIDGRPHPLSIFGVDAPDRFLPTSIGAWASAVSEGDEWRAERICEAMPTEYGNEWNRYTFLPLMGRGMNCPIPPTFLPHGLRILQLGPDFNSPLEPHCIPSTVEILDLGSAYDHPLSVEVLPPSLIHLMLGEVWNHPIPPHSLPPTLECLSFGTCFNQLLVKDSLPSSLQVLELGARFDQPLLAQVLPPSLTIMNLPHWASPCVLPPHLISLFLMDADSFHEPLLPQWLPSTLRELFIGDLCTHPLLPGSLPEGLQFLRVGGRYYQKALDLDILPSSLVALDLSPVSSNCIGQLLLPSGLRCLRLNLSFEQRLRQLRLPVGLRVNWEEDE